MAGPDRDIAAVRIGPESDRAGAAEGASKLISAVSSHPDSNAAALFPVAAAANRAIFLGRPRSVAEV